MNTTTLIIAALYLLGCVLSHGRVTSYNYNIHATYLNTFDSYEVKDKPSSHMLVSILSWITFIRFTWMYVCEPERTFLKWSYRGLNKDRYGY